MALWNSNGLQQHKPELEIFLEESKIDVCFISEAHFTRETSFKIHGFKTYHTLHPSNKARGGAVVIVRANIKHHEEPKFSSEFIQASTISLECKRYKFATTTIYSPPKHNIKKDEYIEFLNTLGNTFIAGRDFNVKHTHWCSKYVSGKGRELFLAGKSHKCEFLSSGSPSYWPTDLNRHPDVIDFLLLKDYQLNILK